MQGPVASTLVSDGPLLERAERAIQHGLRRAQDAIAGVRDWIDEHRPGRAVALHRQPASAANASREADSAGSRRRRTHGAEAVVVVSRSGGAREVALVASAAEGKKSAMSLGDFLGNMAAGGLAGGTVEAALFPIDTIKTRVQAAARGAKLDFTGLYNGLAPNIMGAVPASALFFAVYEPVKRHLLHALPESWSAGAHMVAAAAAGTAASLVRVPTEVIKQRMQMKEFGSTAAAIRGIISKEGARGLYAGYGSFLLRDLPFDAIEFVVYEQLKIAVRKLKGGKDLNALETALSGGAAGAATATLTTPLDVIKTRLMTQGARGTYKGVLDCARQLIAAEGPAALFRGVGPRVMWISIGGSVFFVALEAAKKALGVAD